ncbi:hypothetical protein RJ639_029970 [Escallonia herrerae]|uniref:CCHC-type domain-containing protein n=1 Tax=Escallonia herrerae TaxID=1293975 RepID=A0AA88X2K1_9ASTE|nr:hypothetical protein RJ639_029970 [Escallonia herrerae]
MAPNTSTKYDLEKFDGLNDFSLWRMKMRAVLIQQGFLKALKGKQGLPDTMSDDEKEDMLERAHSALLLGEEHGDGLMAQGRSTDHARSRNKERSMSQSKTRKLKCYHCHKEGHYIKDCPEHKGKKKDKSKTADAGIAEDNSNGADVLSVTISSQIEGGFLIRVAPIICSIQIRMHDGIVRTLTDVRHVPELRKFLISLGTLDSNGCSYRAAGGVMRIMKGALVVLKRLTQNSLYLLQGSTVTGAAATIASSSDIDNDTTKLWHMRLGHMSERGMDVLSKQSLLGSKKIKKLDFCELCVFGKQCRVKFSQAVRTTKDHGVKEKVELEVRAPDSLPIIPTDDDDGSHFIEENEDSQEQQYNIARNGP